MTATPKRGTKEHAFQWLENASHFGLQNLADAWPIISREYRSAPFIAELTARKDKLKAQLQKRAA